MTYILSFRRKRQNAGQRIHRSQQNQKQQFKLPLVFLIFEVDTGNSKAFGIHMTTIS